MAAMMLKALMTIPLLMTEMLMMMTMMIMIKKGAASASLSLVGKKGAASAYFFWVLWTSTMKKKEIVPLRLVNVNKLVEKDMVFSLFI